MSAVRFVQRSKDVIAVGGRIDATPETGGIVYQHHFCVRYDCVRTVVHNALHTRRDHGRQDSHRSHLASLLLSKGGIRPRKPEALRQEMSFGKAEVAIRKSHQI